MASKASAPGAARMTTRASATSMKAAAPPPPSKDAVASARGTSRPQAPDVMPPATSARPPAPESVTASLAGIKPGPAVTSQDGPDQRDVLRLDVDDLQSAFDRLVETGGPPSEGTLELDAQTKREHADLFAQMAVDHAMPIREFILELSVGDTTKQWIDVVRPAVQVLRRSAAQVNGGSVATVLERLETALDEATRAQGSKIQAEARNNILSTYAAVAEEMPGAFELGSERERREVVLVHQLLLQVPGVHKFTTDRVYAAGLGALQKLCTATPSELDAVTGIGKERAEAIAAHFRAYWNERTRTASESAADGLKRRLRGVVDALSKAQERTRRRSKSQT
jgi:hypothetical protein